MGTIFNTQDGRLCNTWGQLLQFLSQEVTFGARETDFAFPFGASIPKMTTPPSELANPPEGLACTLEISRLTVPMKSA